MKIYQICIIIVFLGACLTATELAFAQELELFELDDFIDPKELRTTLSGKPTDPKMFLASRVYAGIDYHYQFRNEFPKANIGFLRVANSFYLSTFQTNLKLTWLRADGSCANTAKRDVLPCFKSRYQIAGYFSTEPDYTDGRWQLSWNAEKLSHGNCAHEFSFDLTVADPFFETPFVGGFILAWQPREDKDELYFGFAYRYLTEEWSSGSNWKWGLGLSGGRSEAGWRQMLRIETSVEYAKLPLSSAFHAICSFSLRHRTWNHWSSNFEVGVFLDIPIFELLF